VAYSNQKSKPMPTQKVPCIVCESPAAVGNVGSGDVAYDCPRCGAFALSSSAAATLPPMLTEVPLRRSLMSHTLRRMQRPETSRLHKITTDGLPSFWAQGSLPTPSQQANALIGWIGDNQPTSFDLVEIRRSEIAAIIGLQISRNDDADGFSWLNTQLEPKKLYELGPRANNVLALKLTMAGWEKHEEFKKTTVESRTAFMAMKFGQANLNRAVDECFRPAVAKTGFVLRLLTDKQPAGLIDNQLRAAILASRFVISDLTHGSPGAYWEAGYGEGLGLPVIYTCEKSAWRKQKTHFDTNHLKTIIWDVAELKHAEDELTATIRATLRAEAKQTDD
jgi:hypothetical protein